MSKARTSKRPRNYIAYFTLCDAISGQIEDAARSIGKSGIHAPLFHSHIIADLQSLKGFCDRAIAAVNAAQKDWSAAPPVQEQGT